MESNPTFRQDKMLKYLTENRILMQAYAPIRHADSNLLYDPILTSIGYRHNKSSVQVALRWQMERKVPLLIKSSKPDRIISNYDVFDFRLNQTEMEMIDNVEQRERFFIMPGAENHPDYPFYEE